MFLLKTDQLVPDSEPLGSFRVLGVRESMLFSEVLMPQKNRSQRSARAKETSQTAAAYRFWP
jgi:hypothetical protein